MISNSQSMKLVQEMNEVHKISFLSVIENHKRLEFIVVETIYVSKNERNELITQ